MTLTNHCLDRMRALCSAVGYSDAETEAAEPTFRLLTTSFGDRCAPRSDWPSDLTDDGTPFEASVAFGGPRPEVRLLTEVQGGSTVFDHWRAARAFARQLSRLGVPTERFEEVADLFEPGAGARFAAWFAAVTAPGRPPMFKVYLNPLATQDRARARITSALERLGLQGIELPPCADDELAYLALDLDDDRPRVKVYTLHRRADAERIERAVAIARETRAGDAGRFCDAVGGPGPWTGRPVFTCLTYRTPGPPEHATVHFPVRSYVHDDAEARDRVSPLLHPADQPLYAAALDAYARRPLDAGAGLQTYASLRLEAGRRRLTVYLAPQLGGPR